MTDTIPVLTRPDAPAPGAIPARGAAGGSGDFDFLHGRWRVHNRRLARPLSGADEWIEFGGTSRVRPLWDGRANLEEWEGDAPGGRIRAVSLHLHDPRSGEWRLHWATRDTGRVGPPATGSFRGGRGEFYSHEEWEGRTIFLRLVWEDRGPAACRFEQAFSVDGGRSWETNWIMDFTREAGSPSDPDSAPVPHRCIAAPALSIATTTLAAESQDAAGTGTAPPRDGAHDFYFLHGTWRIHNRRLRHPLTGSGEWFEFDGHAVERPLWDGEANLEEYEATLPGGTRIHGLALRLYDPVAKRWTIHWSSSANGRLDPPLAGTFHDGVGEFLGHEDYQGRMILVRFRWTSAGPDAARWEQAFSPDGGRSWETNWIMEFTRTGGGAGQPGASSLADRAAPAPPHAPEGTQCCAVVELRQYLLHPGTRETLVDLFDREFVETQEEVGMTVVAQFRDIDRPDVFTWFRGFADMPSRARALAAFYGGPAWARHRDAANGTMISSDDVHLLRPARPGSGLVPGDRPPAGGAALPRGVVLATVYPLPRPAAEGFTDFFERTVAPRLAASGAKPFAMLETEPAENTFPRHPVHEGEHVFVWLARFPDAAACDRHAAALAGDPVWAEEVGPALERRLAGPIGILRLAPTARSRTLR